MKNFEYSSLVAIDDFDLTENPIFDPQISASPIDETDSNENSEIFSDLVLEYINQMLMEEDMGDKFDMLLTHPDLEATEKPFYELIGEKYPSSPDQPPLYSSPSPDSSDSRRSSGSKAPMSSENGASSFSEEPEDHKDGVDDLLLRTLPQSQFEKGFEEAKKFLPTPSMEVKIAVDRRRPHNDSFDLEEQRSRKQSAVYYEDPIPSQMFDMVLLCGGEKFPEVINTIREAMHKEENGEKKDGRKSRRKKPPEKEEVVDLHTLLMHCAQTVAAGEHHRAHELLKQIRRHSSPHGDASQRLGHYFANGLEARLAGTGSEVFQSLASMRKTAADVLKAYQLYLAASPFKKISYHFSNQTILDAIEKATRVHILDFGIYFGFQWPCFMKMLAARPGGPPKLRITGIDVPQPGFRPAERIEETGRWLSDYAERFGVPFEYHAVAAKLDEVRNEDLRLDEEETLVVNCVFRLSCLGDETVGVDCPRDKLLRKIRKLNPAVFVNVISNGSYGAPFFVTRFREALYHFSAVFDMLESTLPREEEQRMLVERDLYGRHAINVISCEGKERVQRPETYKQSRVRCMRAGFEQLPANYEFVKAARSGVRAHYHKDFSVDEDGRWLLQGWKGRILVALSAWKPCSF